MQKSELRIALMIIAGTLLLGACSIFRAPDDKALATEIQAKVFDDPVLKTRDVRVTSEKGVVTLAGTVNTELEKAAVEHLAGQASGVKSVVNQLVVSSSAAASPAPEAPAPAVAAAPPPETPASEPARSKPARHLPAQAGHERASTARSAQGASDASAVTEAATPPAPAPATTAVAEAAPPPEKITVPAGTVLTVRMIDGIDSTRNRPGQEFSASLQAPVVVGERVVIPSGADARVRLVEARTSGHITGRSELQVELVSVAAGNNLHDVESTVIEKQGASLGTRTAETVGGGAILGGLIGAIAGRGKGAAIGAAIGAGAGTATQVATHGEQVRIPSETKLDFVLKSPLTVTK